MLRKMNCEVDVAEDGAYALDMFEPGRYAIVFMDIQMPRMDGYETTAAIRRMEEGAEQRQPIVAMTANALVGDREKCLRAGMDDYIAKPVMPPILAVILDKWLDAEI